MTGEIVLAILFHYQNEMQLKVISWLVLQNHATSQVDGLTLRYTETFPPLSLNIVEYSEL